VRGDGFGPAVRISPAPQVTSHNSRRSGELAQLGERLVCNQEVTGSSPVFSTTLRPLRGRRLASQARVMGEGRRPKGGRTTGLLWADGRGPEADRLFDN
jgi:hypothetical protein